ncbi:hypothetical protein BWK58_08835 [Flavobacterium columnare]|nr:hypothetical protein BWK58_08835 [Flavobacterium columnare]
MKKYDLIGVGIGPSNLSTAALLKPISDSFQSVFFDDKKLFNWHPGLMFPDAKLQVSILKDLVSMLDPTSQFSFLNYLKEKKKLYMFAARNGFNNVKRKEFEDYLLWVSSKLENLKFGQTVKEISYDNDCFKVAVNDEILYAKNIIMGAGLTGVIPDFCKKLLGSTCFHSSQFLKEYNNYSSKIVTIIGGGQSSCEILKFILELEKDEQPAHINWVFKNHKLDVLEDTPFSNELYTPNYSQYIFNSDAAKRNDIINRQKFTSDGVSSETLDQIYDLLYHNEIGNYLSIKIFNESKLTNVKSTDKTYELEINNNSSFKSDVIILGTGYKYGIPKCILDLSANYEKVDEMFIVDEEYRLVPKNKDLKGNIYIHNGARHIRGVADPNLSLLAWRSGVIINSLMNKEVYDVTNEKSILSWS